MWYWFRNSPLHTHRFIVNEDNSMHRRCRCGAEEWIFEKQNPKVGEARYNWVNLDDIGK